MYDFLNDMKQVLYLLTLLLLAAVTTSAQNVRKEWKEPGVSHELAQFRKAHYQNVRYDLFFHIPSVKSQKVTGTETLAFNTKESLPVMIDFRAEASQIHSVKLNGSVVRYTLQQEHILLASSSRIGENSVEISFTAADQSLNRRDEFLYTLLVPDRARTLFPCFDQPDLKSRFTLKLDVPAEWNAVGNGPLLNESVNASAGRKTVTFRQTEPLSTYLFSFVVGKLTKETFERNGRSLSIYHRETDPKKAAQTKDIASQVFDALEWQENYTAIPYPFAKYDLIIIPGFQYGGMEHTGATLYNDRRMFLEDNPTLDEQLNRATLIAHETSHMWFGDYVTMAWFNDVWTKEVFANYFAAAIVDPQFPAVNHRLNFITSYVPSAYSEDRTAGSNPIQQQLDNLQNAGLVYGNIIYDKSPVVLEMLARKLGNTAFRDGLREYLKTYAYSNATWDNLIAILDKYTKDDLTSWSRVWCREEGMPEVSAAIVGDSLVVEQRDPLKRGLLWPQDLKYAIIYKGKTDTLTVSLTAQSSLSVVKLPEKADADALIIPNVDGRGYGFFRIRSAKADELFSAMLGSKDDVMRSSILMTLYENMMNAVVTPDWLCKSLLRSLPSETNPLLYSLSMSYLSGALRLMAVQPQELEPALRSIVSDNASESFRLQAFRMLISRSRSDATNNWLYTIWKTRQAPEGCSLSENDYVNMSYELAIRMPDRADAIVAEQYSRLTNPDRKAQYRFISPSVSPMSSVRDSVFQSLMKADNRRVEPWASSALSYLNHPLRQAESIKYIRPALEKLQEVQRTGDIFFPSSWVGALLQGHNTKAARDEVDSFFRSHPDYPKMLGLKIKQRADHLYRIR